MTASARQKPATKPEPELPPTFERALHIGRRLVRRNWQLTTTADCGDCGVRLPDPRGAYAHSAEHRHTVGLSFTTSYVLFPYEAVAGNA